jgi:hypothetical protein
MNQRNRFRQLHYVHVRQVSPSQYEISISHPSTSGNPIVMVYQFKSKSAAEIAALHYEELVKKAYQIGYRLDGYFLYGPSGQVLPVSDVFDLDMSIGHVERRLSSLLGSIDTGKGADFPEIQPIL